jgi:hypothetical protein
VRLNKVVSGVHRLPCVQVKITQACLLSTAPLVRQAHCKDAYKLNRRDFPETVIKLFESETEERGILCPLSWML